MSSLVKGIVHGKVIQIETELDLPDGQPVTLIVQPLETRPATAPSERFLHSFGGWAEDAAGLDEFLKEVRRGRADDRPEPDA